MIITTPPPGVDPAMWEQLLAEVTAVRADLIRARSAVKRQGEHLTALEALVETIAATS